MLVVSPLTHLPNETHLGLKPSFLKRTQRNPCPDTLFWLRALCAQPHPQSDITGEGLGHGVGLTAIQGPNQILTDTSKNIG